jgi:hypothetical protein
LYDVTEEVVQVLAIVQNSEADAWLAKHGENGVGKRVSVCAREAWERGRSDLKPFIETLWVTNPTR